MSETVQPCPTCGRVAPQAPDSEFTGSVAIVLAGLTAFALYVLYKPAFILSGFALAWPQFKVMAAFDVLGPKGLLALQLIEDTLAFRVDAWRVPYGVFSHILSNTPMFSSVGMALIAMAAAFLVHRRMRANAPAR